MKKGFTFIEILIAIMFFVIGFFALSALFNSSNKQVYTAQFDLFAYSLARERISWISESDFSTVNHAHDLLKQEVIQNGYKYKDMNGLYQSFTYPEFYQRFYVSSEVSSEGSFKKLSVAVSYKVKTEDPTREVRLERIVSNE